MTMGSRADAFDITGAVVELVLPGVAGAVLVVTMSVEELGPAPVELDGVAATDGTPEPAWLVLVTLAAAPRDAPVGTSEEQPTIRAQSATWTLRAKRSCLAAYCVMGMLGTTLAACKGWGARLLSCVGFGRGTEFFCARQVGCDSAALACERTRAHECLKT